MNRSLVNYIGAFILYLLLQVTLVRNLVLFDYAFCYVYIAYLLLIPLGTGPILMMTLGFVMGLSVDIFYDSLGIHTAASVLLCYMRKHWVNLSEPRGGYEGEIAPNPKTLSLSWFAGYALPLIFLHHAVLFFVDAGNFQLFFPTILKVIASTFFSFLVITLLQYLIPRSKEV